MKVESSKIILGLLIGDERPNSFEQACHEQLNKIKVIDYVIWFTRSQYAQVQDHNLDVLIIFGSMNGLPQNWVESSIADVYGFSFGDFDTCRDFGVHEVAFNQNLQTVQFLKLIDADKGTALVLRQARIKTNLLSLISHRKAVLEQVAAWPAGVITAVTQSSDQLKGRAKSRPLVKLPAVSARFRRRLTRLLAWSVLPWRLFGAQVQHWFARIGRAFTYQKWNIGVIRAPIERLLDPGYQPKIEWLPAPQWPWSVADPFPVRFEGKTFVMVELFDFTLNRGEISAMEMTVDGNLRESFRSLSFPFHMSYPCVLSHEGELYCLPEALEVEGLTIYKAGRFPTLWYSHVRILNDGAYADPTLFRFDNRWWVTATGFDPDSQGNSTLFAWWADELEGPWTAHAQNPIKMDVTSSRSAGTPFVHMGRLYRPTQNCSCHYGGSVVINVVKTLTPTEFEETHVRELFPDAQYPNAFHHISQFGEITFVDGRRDLFYPAALIGKLAKRLQISKLARKPQTRAREFDVSTSPVKLEVVPSSSSNLPSSKYE